MNLSLYSGATGMQTKQLNLNVISNNIANVNTTGYKKNKIEFQDLLYQTRDNRRPNWCGNVIPTSVEMANGTKVVSTTKVFGVNLRKRTRRWMLRLMVVVFQVESLWN